jgi:hypothetical protein
VISIVVWWVVLWNKQREDFPDEVVLGSMVGGAASARECKRYEEMTS